MSHAISEEEKKLRAIVKELKTRGYLVKMSLSRPLGEMLPTSSSADTTHAQVSSGTTRVTMDAYMHPTIKMAWCEMTLECGTRVHILCDWLETPPMDSLNLPVVLNPLDGLLGRGWAPCSSI